MVDLATALESTYPRLLWQAIFDIYRKENGNLKSMDNMLLDYERCKEFFNENHTTFVWILVHTKTGRTLWKVEPDNVTFLSLTYLAHAAVVGHYNKKELKITLDKSYPSQFP